MLAQYVKDLSFESPGAPNSLRGREQSPGIAINVNVNAAVVGNRFDVARGVARGLRDMTRLMGSRG